MILRNASIQTKIQAALVAGVVLAGLSLSGCNRNLTPKITITPQSGGVFLISGTGFTATSAACVNVFAAGSPSFTTGSTTAGSAVLTGVASLNGIVVGQLISDNQGNIPGGAYVMAVSGSTITISANATAASTGDNFTIETGLPGMKDFFLLAQVGTVNCSGGSWSYSWTPKLQACASGPSAPTSLPVFVFAFDHPSIDPATATTTVPCTPPVPPGGGGTAGMGCPGAPTGSQIPSNAWSASSTLPGYYALDSAIINDGNGAVVIGSASYAQVKSYMGSAFGSSVFNVVSAGGGASNLPSNVMSCIYDGPRFKYGTSTLQATVTVNCTNNSCGTF